MSVNVSVIQIESGALFRDINTALIASGLPPSRLRLELTESVFAGDHRKIIPVLEKLREMEVKISLDDFGTGFSCLADLRRLPIDQLKIDRSFVASMSLDSGAIVRAIVATAQAFRLEVVAEGVETEAQAKQLMALGVEYVQGIYSLLVFQPMRRSAGYGHAGDRSAQTPLKGFRLTETRIRI